MSVCCVCVCVRWWTEAGHQPCHGDYQSSFPWHIIQLLLPIFYVQYFARFFYLLMYIAREGSGQVPIYGDVADFWIRLNIDWANSTFNCVQINLIWYWLLMTILSSFDKWVSFDPIFMLVKYFFQFFLSSKLLCFIYGGHCNMGKNIYYNCVYVNMHSKKKMNCSSFFHWLIDVRKSLRTKNRISVHVLECIELLSLFAITLLSSRGHRIEEFLNKQLSAVQIL